MNLVISTIVLTILVLLMWRQIKVWRWRCLLSPGFYFGLVWTFGVIGVLVFDSLGLLEVVFPQYLDELNIFVGFTGLCFLLFTQWGANKIDTDSAVDISYIRSYTLFGVLSVLLFIVAVATFVSAGASFNMGESRQMLREHEASQSFLAGYFLTLSAPLCIFAGSLIAKFMSGRLQLSPHMRIIVFVPLLANLVFSIYLGGRVNFVYGLLEYVVGFCLSTKISESKRFNKKVVSIAVVGFLALSFAISAVNMQRDSSYGHDAVENLMDEHPFLRFAYGPTGYVASSYVAYQYRRIDAVDLGKLRYGLYTLNGFINWTLPFSSWYGLFDFSIAKSLDVYYNPQETYDYVRPHYNSTHSCYIPLVKDFGTGWIYLAIICITFIAHWLFVKIQQYKVINRGVTLFFFYIFFNYWLKSNFYSTLSSPILIHLYGFLIIDILSRNFMTVYRNIRTNDEI